MQAADSNAEPPEAQSSRRQRRWLQFSLRTLLILTMIRIWLGVTAIRASRQSRAVETIIHARGTSVLQLRRRAVEFGVWHILANLVRADKDCGQPVFLTLPAPTSPPNSAIPGRVFRAPPTFSGWRDRLQLVDGVRRGPPFNRLVGSEVTPPAGGVFSSAAITRRGHSHAGSQAMRTIAGVVVMLFGVILFATTGDRVVLQIVSGVLFVAGSLSVFTTISNRPNRC
jgi:hypothetical protein